MSAAVPAVPTQASATRGLVICWNDAEQRADEAERPFLVALRRRLVDAGYDVTSLTCDVSFGYGWTTREEHGDKGFTSVTLTLSHGAGVVDKIKLDFNDVTDVPISDPDRLAILLVNAMNKSEKLARLTSEEHPPETLRKRASPACDETDDAGCLTPRGRALIQ